MMCRDMASRSPTNTFMRVLLSSALANVWFSKTLSQLLIGKVF